MTGSPLDDLINRGVELAPQVQRERDLWVQVALASRAWTRGLGATSKAHEEMIALGGLSVPRLAGQLTPPGETADRIAALREAFDAATDAVAHHLDKAEDAARRHAAQETER